MVEGVVACATIVTEDRAASANTPFAITESPPSFYDEHCTPLTEAFGQRVQ
jgi:hypothetical protein